LFVLPAAVLLWALSWIYAAHGNLPWIVAIFGGLKPAVTAIVAAAVIRIAQRALKTPARWAVAAGAFAAIFFLRVPFPAIVAIAAAIGFFSAMGKGSEARTENAGESTRPTWTVCSVLAVLWFAPVIAAAVWQGTDGVLVREGVFFSKAAMVTFGGAYAVLPYVAQHAVEEFGWLTAAQMIDGLGLAETTPGPLIMVVQFVGFLGAWNQPGALSPLAMATLGAAMTTWTTFVPCFLWIFLGAPYLERLRANVKLGAALATVTAAVVGVVLNLAVWFGGQVFFPAGGGVDWFAVAVAVVAFGAMQFFRVGIVTIVLASGVAGLGWSWLASG
jgi:chromate transporter